MASICGLMYRIVPSESKAQTYVTVGICSTRAR